MSAILKGKYYNYVTTANTMNQNKKRIKKRKYHSHQLKVLLRVLFQARIKRTEVTAPGQDQNQLKEKSHHHHQAVRN